MSLSCSSMSLSWKVGSWPPGNLAENLGLLICKLCLMKVLVTQSCLTLGDPMDCSLPGSSIHGIFQARIQEPGAMPFSRGSFRPRDQTQVFCLAGRFFTIWDTREAPDAWWRTSNSLWSLWVQTWGDMKEPHSTKRNFVYALWGPESEILPLPPADAIEI